MKGHVLWRLEVAGATPDESIGNKVIDITATNTVATWPL